MNARGAELRDPVPAPLAGERGRPVLLTTLGVPVDEEASAFAVDTAVETGQDLVVANVTRLEPLSLSVRLGYDALEELTPDVSASLQRWCGIATSLGVHVERLRVRSPRPITALLELAREVEAGIVVFGPDRSAMGARAYRRALSRLASDCACLVWAPATS